MRLSDTTTSGPAFGSSHASPNTTGDTTKQKLLDTAELLFAEQGYAETSVRDITAAAECNLASINYHFGGKESLYAEVFQRALADLREYRLARVQVVLDSETPTLEALLSAFSVAFLEPLVENHRGRLLMLLFHRECNMPLLPSEMFFSELIDPLSKQMFEGYDLTCPGLTAEQKGLCLNSLVGQLMFVVQSARMYEMASRNEAPILDHEKMVGHIVRFSVAGTRNYLENKA